MLRFSGAGVSDVGCVRPGNEDSGFVGPYVAVVADGVGGAAAGEIASATAAYAVSATALGRAGETPELVLEDATRTARDSIRIGVQRDLGRLGMATTLTAVVCDGRRVAMAHVGDSRAYLSRHGSLHQLSRDDTWVQLMVDQGYMSRAVASQHPWRNVVVRSLDGDPDSEPVDVVALDVRAGDRLLLCSDGLTDLVDHDRIATVLELQDPRSAAAVLTQSALMAGGRDNITCLVLDLVEGPAVVGDGQLLGALRDPRNVVDASAVRLH